nr:hypothetical protein [Tanacetum cinerariifolium]
MIKTHSLSHKTFYREKPWRIKSNLYVSISFSSSSQDMALALPPRDQRHQYLRYEGLQYTDVDIVDFETSLARIYRRAVHRVQSPVSARAHLEFFSTLSIARRSQAPEKVTMTNLFYLRGMGVGSINVPYLLAMYLRLFASRRKQGAMISGGGVVEEAPVASCDGDKDEEMPQAVPPPPRTQGERIARLEEEVHGMCEAFQGQREGRCALHEITESPIEYQRRTK